MNRTTELHNASMDNAELGFVARMQGKQEEAIQFFQKALDLELQAIEAMEKDSIAEPTYSILHRSAATLALDCSNPRLAEKIIGKALANEPPLEIVEELRDLLEQVNFRRHLQLRGIALDEDELQMSLAGQGVGLGVVESDEFLQRIDDASKLIYRIVERQQQRPFRERGRVKQAVKDDYELFISVPRAASFAVTMKLGQPSAQAQLPGMSGVSDIVDEFMELMSLINKADFQKIESYIPDPAYRTNFIQLAKRLAPDGNNIKLVGFTSIRKGQEKFVEVTRPKPEIIPPSLNLSNQGNKEISEKVTISGVLRYADATHEESSHIKIIDKNSQTYQIKVPEGMMNDIVKPLWDCAVIIKGVRNGKDIILEEIEEQQNKE